VSCYTGVGIPALHTSAFTAARFFRWLNASERFSAAPLRRCWVLLSPTAVELGKDGGPNYVDLPPGSYGSADWNGFEKALSAWRNAMSTIAGAGESRAIFYFCGHGVEFAARRQILLPADYRSTIVPTSSRALSTENLVNGLANLAAVNEQFFFFDACRSSGNLRATVAPKGWPVFDEPTAEELNLACQALTFRATVAGGIAQQYADPARGGSFFGEALNSALTSDLKESPPFQPDCTSSPCVVRLVPLHSFLIDKLAKLFGTPGAKMVPVGGEITNFNTVIAEVPDHGPPSPLNLSSEPGLPGIAMSISRALNGHDDRGKPLPGLLKTPAESANLSFLVSATPNPYDALNKYKHIADFYKGIEQWSSYDTRTWVRSRSFLELHKVEINSNSVTIQFSIYGEASLFKWLSFRTYDGQPISFLLTQPAAQVAQPRQSKPAIYEIQSVWNGTNLLDASIDLADSNWGLLGIAARLWSNYTDLSVFSEVQDLPIARLVEETLRKKNQSPLAAEIALLILLKARRFDLIHDWDSNLANLASNSDGAVLALRRLLRDPNASKSRLEMLRYIQLIYQKGMPTLSESYDTIFDTLEYVASSTNSAPISSASDSHVLRLIELEISKLQGWLQPFRSKPGLFASFHSEGPVTWDR